MISTTRQIPVFLSYTDADYHRGVASLKELLDGSGYDAYSFRDDHPSPELNFASNVQAALQKAQFVVVIWSRNTEDHPSMVLREVSIARSLRKHIILLLLDKVKKPPILLAMADGIPAFDGQISWEGLVAERLAVWVDHPPKLPPSHDPSNAPKWLNGLTFVLCAGVAAYLAGKRAWNS